jgi:hypothetical protein
VHADSTKGRPWIEPQPMLSSKAFLANIHRKLQEAASISKAAEICAETGNVQTAVKMVMDIEDATHQANRMLNAALPIYNDLLNEELH